MEKGKLIVFEGLDGAGTTTQMKILEKAYLERKKKVFTTHEPTDNPIGKLVRSALRKEFTTTASALALLYASDRDDHLNNSEYGIEKYLREGYTVISDRYFYSSIAYQGVELGFDYPYSLNSRFPNADAIIYIDTPVEDSISRIERRGEKKELFEKEEFLRKVRENYSLLFSSLDKSVTLIKINGTKSIEEISATIIHELENLSLL